jgi:hypothetical protein
VGLAARRAPGDGGAPSDEVWSAPRWLPTPCVLGSALRCMRSRSRPGRRVAVRRPVGRWRALAILDSGSAIRRAEPRGRRRGVAVGLRRPPRRRAVRSGERGGALPAGGRAARARPPRSSGTSTSIFGRRACARCAPASRKLTACWRSTGARGSPSGFALPRNRACRWWWSVTRRLPSSPTMSMPISSLRRRGLGPARRAVGAPGPRGGRLSPARGASGPRRGRPGAHGGCRPRVGSRRTSRPKRCALEWPGSSTRPRVARRRRGHAPGREAREPGAEGGEGGGHGGRSRPRARTRAAPT